MSRLTTPSLTSLSPTPAAWTLNRLCADFLDDGRRSGRWKEGRAKSMACYLRRLCAFTPDGSDRPLGQLTPDVLTRDELEAWLRRIAERPGRGGRAITITQVGEHRGAAILMLEHAQLERGALSDDHLTTLKRTRLPKLSQCPARPAEKVTAIPDADLDALQEYLIAKVTKLRREQPRLKKRRDKARLLALALVLLRQTGMRPGELLNLSDAELRWVRQPGDEMTLLYEPAKHKTMDKGHARMIVLDDAAQAALWESREIRQQQQLSFSWRPVFHWTRVNSVYSGLRRALKDAGLTHHSLYAIRHRFATEAVRVDVEGTRVQMGHRDIRTTMGYLDDEAAAAVGLFAKMG